MKIVFGCDPNATEFKLQLMEYVKGLGHEVADLGSDDPIYANTAIEVAKAYGVKFSLERAWGATDYLDEIVESGCDICYGPIATYRSPGERRKVDVEAVKMLDDRGVNVAMITDSPILSEESLYHHIGEAVREGVSQERAVRMVTINPARQLNLDDRLGSLEVGKDADIVIMKGKLGLDTDAKVLYTMVDGKIVYQA